MPRRGLRRRSARVVTTAVVDAAAAAAARRWIRGGRKAPSVPRRGLVPAAENADWKAKGNCGAVASTHLAAPWPARGHPARAGRRRPARAFACDRADDLG